MRTDAEDRRRSRRWTPSGTEALSRVRLRTGRELSVLNVSPAGALVEGATRLLPGTNVDVHVTAAQGRVLVRARVIRCLVSTVTADVVLYRGALVFSVHVELPPMALATTETPAELATDRQTAGSSHPGVEPESTGSP